MYVDIEYMKQRNKTKQTKSQIEVLQRHLHDEKTELKQAQKELDDLRRVEKQGELISRVTNTNMLQKKIVAIDACLKAPIRQLQKQLVVLLRLLIQHNAVDYREDELSLVQNFISKSEALDACEMQISRNKSMHSVFRCRSIEEVLDPDSLAPSPTPVRSDFIYPVVLQTLHINMLRCR